jgi:hypothetical protein
MVHDPKMKCRRIPGYFFLLVGSLLSSCSKKAEPSQLYYYASGAGLAGAEILVNGNPTNQGRAFSHFVISGVNWVQIKGDIPAGGYNFRLGKSPGLFSSEYRDVIVHQEERSGFSEDRIFSFNESNWPRWAWQDADQIESFEENDLKEIRSIVGQIFDALKKERPDAKTLFNLPRTKPWTDDPSVLKRTNDEILKVLWVINSYEKLIHERAPEEELTASVGKQLVLIRAKSGTIFYIGRDKKSIPEPEVGGKAVWNYSFGEDDMFFAKFNGQWTWLMPTM